MPSDHPVTARYGTRGCQRRIVNDDQINPNVYFGRLWPLYPNGRSSAYAVDGKSPRRILNHEAPIHPKRIAKSLQSTLYASHGGTAMETRSDGAGRGTARESDRRLGRKRTDEPYSVAQECARSDRGGNRPPLSGSPRRACPRATAVRPSGLAGESQRAR